MSRPHRAPLWVVGLLATTGCKDLLAALEQPDPNCDPRSAFWADTDGDGVGDDGTLYVGCKAPDGYVDVPPLDTDTDAPSDTDAAAR